MSSPRRRAKHIWEPIYWILIWCVIREHHGFVSVGLSVCVGRHGKTRTQIHVDIIPRVKHLKGFSPLCFQYGPIYSVNDFWRYSTKWIDPYSNKKENEENLLNVTRSYVQMLFVYAKWVVGPHLCADMMCVHFSQKKIRSTTQTHRRLLSTLERVRSPSAVRFIGIGFLFRNSLCVLSSSSVGWVLESILFHSSFSSFFFFSMFTARGSVFTFTLHTHIWRIIIFGHVLRVRAEKAADVRESSCSFMTWRRSLNAQEKNKLNDVVRKSARMNSMDYANHFFHSVHFIFLVCVWNRRQDMKFVQ